MTRIDLSRLPTELRDGRWTITNAEKKPVDRSLKLRQGDWWDRADDLQTVLDVIKKANDPTLRPGFVFQSDRRNSGVDLDKVRDPRTGEVVPWARGLVERLDSYTEVSPSGTGLHVLLSGPKPAGFDDCEANGQTDYKGAKTAKIEVYDHGRQFVTTGEVFEDYDQLSDSSALDFVQQEFFGDKQKSREELDRAVREGVPEGSRDVVATRFVGRLFASGMTEQEVLVAARTWNYKNSPPLDDAQIAKVVKSIGRRHRRNEVGARGLDATRPTIRVTRGESHATMRAAEEALLRAADVEPIYQRGSELARVVRLVEPDTLRQGATIPAHTPVIMSVEQTFLCARFEASANFVKRLVREKGWTRTDCPPRVAKLYMESAGEWRVPRLSAIVQAPTLRPDGTVLQKPGYDAATGILFDDAGIAFPEIPEHPTLEDAQDALRTLCGPVRAFPWAYEWDRSVWLAALLTTFLRPSLPAAPLFIFDSPTRGSGKTMLSRLVSIIASGVEPATMVAVDREEELHKSLFALLLRGAQVIVIDNVDHVMEGASLCAMLTSPKIEGRILGLSKTADVPTKVTLLANGNNLLVRGDLTRRAVLCRIDPKVEKPENRLFDFDPLELAAQRRPQLVVAALTLLRAHAAAGYPADVPPMGSFETWSRKIRGALVWAGEPDPARGCEAVCEADDAMAGMKALTCAWRRAFGANKMTIRDAIAEAETSESAFATESTTSPGTELLAAIRALVDGVDHNQRNRVLGNRIAAVRGRVFSGLRFVSTGVAAGGLCQWSVEDVGRVRLGHALEQLL